ncbi:hypothetical protein EDB19DRAFT_1912665 [Suillus lakei]|nr:hypothetical protein EDB19DRAFT_1912665 [Suillus lakei]
MAISSDIILTSDTASTSTSSPSSAKPGDLPPVPYYTTWDDLVDDYYRMSPLSPEDSSDSLSPELQESQLSRSAHIQLLQDNQIALALVFGDDETDSCMSEKSSIPPYSPEGCINEPPIQPPIQLPPIHFLPQGLPAALPLPSVLSRLHCLYAAVIPHYFRVDVFHDFRGATGWPLR